MGIVPKIIGRTEKKYMKHLAQYLAHGKLSNNNVLVFIYYCDCLYINNIFFSVFIVVDKFIIVIKFY